MSNESLEERMKIIQRKGIELKSESEALAPILLADFNAYISETVNPALPEGAAILGDSSVYYSYPYNRFLISAGTLEVLPGLDNEDVSSAKNTALKLFREYSDANKGIYMVECSRVHAVKVKSD